MAVYLSILLVTEIIWHRIMRLLMNDEPGEDLDVSGSGLLLIRRIILICQDGIRLCQAWRMSVDFHVKYPLFMSCFNQNWDEWKNFSGCLQYQTFRTPFNGSGVVTCEWLEIRYRHIHRHTDRHGEKNRRGFATFHCDLAKKKASGLL